MADKPQRPSNPHTPPSKNDDLSPSPTSAATAAHVPDAPDKSNPQAQPDGQTRVIEKHKDTRVFGTPELLHDPNVPSVKIIFDESSFGE